MDYEEFKLPQRAVGTATKLVGGRIMFIPGLILAVIALALLVSGVATMATKHYIWGSILLVLSFVLFRTSKRILIG